MVQIKRKNTSTNIRSIALYIPYGSDKTKTCFLHINRRFILYIPYGSDKTYPSKKICACSRRSFISHMVQIKLENLVMFRSLFLTLYPIWFR